MKGRGKGPNKISDGAEEERTCFGSTGDIGAEVVLDCASKENVGR